MFKSNIGSIIVTKVRSLTFRAIMKQEAGWFDEDANSPGVLLEKLSADSTLVKDAVGPPLGNVLNGISNAAIGLSLAFSYDWRLTLVCLALLPLNAVGVYLQTKVQMSIGNDVITLYQAAIQKAAEIIINIRTVVALNRQAHFNRQYEDLVDEPHKVRIASFFKTSAGFAFAQCSQFISYCVSYYVGAKFITDGLLDFEKMNGVIQTVFFLGMAIGQVSALSPGLVLALQAGVHLFEIIDRKPKMVEGVGKVADEVKGTVSLSQTEFAYPTRPNEKILRGIDIDQIQPGQTIGLVGSSGCGKVIKSV
jgi:ABC-type multidrug transport system fused ATPase/permease subunit